MKQGLRYLDDLGYQVLSDWSPDAQIIDPTTIDWKAVAAGKTEVLMRQLPGPHNSMGRMKFMFPNAAGVYLHDNPERELFTEARGSTAAGACGSRMRRGSAAGCSATTSSGKAPGPRKWCR